MCTVASNPLREQQQFILQHAPRASGGLATAKEVVLVRSLKAEPKYSRQSNNI
jgi:hypothetical protein